MTTNQQVGWAGGHAGIWFGTASSFRDIHPAGADFSEAHATIDTMQVGYATYDSSGRAILWLGSADNYLDLHSVLGSQYRDSDANNIWTDGSKILVAGRAIDRMGLAHPILWNIIAACSISCPTNLAVCADPGECGAVVEFPAPVASNCTGSNIECVPPSGSFFPVGTNLVACVATNSSGQVEDSCSFQVIVRDCEPPKMRRMFALPRRIFRLHGEMVPVRIAVKAKDACGPTRCRIIRVQQTGAVILSNPPQPNWEITGDLTVNLRTPSMTQPRAVVYWIEVECKDSAGNASVRRVAVVAR